MFTYGVAYGSPAQRAGLDFGWELINLQVAADRPPKQLMCFPALLLLGLVAWLQRRRLTNQRPTPSPT